MSDYPYWMALAHLPNWLTEKINSLIVEIIQNRRISFVEFFELNKNEWQNEFQLNEKEVEDLQNTKLELPNYSFLAESLLEQGFSIITINSEEYSKTLKQNLKMKYSPPLLYTKGNIKLLNESSVAIVGSRKASDIALEFTKTIAKNFAKNYQIVVSGFAKGVDKTALDATLEVHGHSIIVLPQGIMTFTSGFKKYYAQIIEGDVLLLSTYHPNVPWSVGLAMGRNIYIYGLADKIYVAETDLKGGTWTGVMDGLKKDRTIYVREPESDEKNANYLLIEKGAIPVDMDGKPIQVEDKKYFELQIKNILSSKPLTAKQIKDCLHLDIDTLKLSQLISSMDFIVSEKIKKVKSFRLKNKKKLQGNLFE